MKLALLVLNTKGNCMGTRICNVGVSGSTDTFELIVNEIKERIKRL
jgi:hypothetical protein